MEIALYVNGNGGSSKLTNVFLMAWSFWKEQIGYCEAVHCSPNRTEFCILSIETLQKCPGLT